MGCPVMTKLVAISDNHSEPSLADATSSISLESFKSKFYDPESIVPTKPPHFPLLQFDKNIHTLLNTGDKVSDGEKIDRKTLEVRVEKVFRNRILDIRRAGERFTTRAPYNILGEEQEEIYEMALDEDLNATGAKELAKLFFKSYFNQSNGGVFNAIGSVSTFILSWFDCRASLVPVFRFKGIADGKLEVQEYVEMVNLSKISDTDMLYDKPENNEPPMVGVSTYIIAADDEGAYLASQQHLVYFNSDLTLEIKQKIVEGFFSRKMSHMVHSTVFDDNLLRDLIVQDDKLTRLNLAGATITDSSVRLIAKKCSQLESLNISGTAVRTLNNFNLTNTRLAFPMLTHLDVSDCAELSLLNLSAPQLKQLRTSNCRKLLDMRVDSPSSLQFFQELGENKIREGCHQDAINIFTKLMKSDSKSPGLFQRGFAKLELEDYQGAIDDFNEFMNDTSKTDEDGRAAALINRAFAHFKLSRFTESFADFSAACALNTQYANVVAMDSESQALAYEGFIKDLRVIINDVNHFWSNVFKGFAQYSVGEDLAAIGSFQRALQLDASNTYVRYLRCLAYFQSGDFQFMLMAIEELTAMLKLDNQYGEAYYLRAKFYLRNSPISIAEIEAAITNGSSATKPNYSEALKFPGRVYSWSKEHETAIQNYLAASQTGVKIIKDTALDKLIKLISATQIMSAIDDCNLAIKSGFNHAKVFKLRGQAHYRLGDYKRAIEDYLTAFRVSATEEQKGEALFELAKLYLERQHYPTAINYFNEAHKLSLIPEALIGKADAYYGLCLYQEAMAAVRSYYVSLDSKADKDYTQISQHLTFKAAERKLRLATANGRPVGLVHLAKALSPNNSFRIIDAGLSIKVDLLANETFASSDSHNKLLKFIFNTIDVRNLKVVLVKNNGLCFELSTLKQCKTVSNEIKSVLLEAGLTQSELELSSQANVGFQP